MEGFFTVFKRFFLLIVTGTFLLSTHLTFGKISTKEWKKLTPYLLPSDHPAKEILDIIFSQDHVLMCVKNMKVAGFINPRPRAFTQLVVTKHPDLPGYVIKTYMDCQRNSKNEPVYTFWIKRIEGANAIRETLSTNQWHDSFKVPRKWIYPLPAAFDHTDDRKRKYFILIEDDMQLVSSKENHALWHSAANEEILDKLFFILYQNGLRDCAKPDNIPFSTDGKIAFVDTATHHRWPIHYSKLNAFLSPSNQKYWKKITEQP